MRSLSLAVVTALLIAEAPAQYGNPARTWAFLAAKYDADGNGTISKKEYPRGERQFDNLDRNGNGELTRHDCEVAAQFNLQQSLAIKADANRDQVVSRTEWQKLWSVLDPDIDGAYDVQKLLEAAELVRPSKKAGRARRRVGGGKGRGGGGGRGKHRVYRLHALQYAMDTNGDRVVTPSDLVGLFDWLDSDGDDILNKAEMHTSRNVIRRPRATLPDPKGGPAKGTPAPDFELPDAREPSKSVRLSKLYGDRPVVVVFGSYTQPVLRSSARRLSEIFDRHRDEVRFLLVYLREARAIDSYTHSGFKVIEDPVTDSERIALAGRCVTELKLPWLTVVDRIDDSTGKAYGAWPVRGFLLGKGGEVLFSSVPGETLDLDGLSQALEKVAPLKR